MERPFCASRSPSLSPDGERAGERILLRSSPSLSLFAMRPHHPFLDLAKNLRQTMTRAERIIWKRLRANRFHGCKFYRQMAIDRFIVDFCCPTQRLIVEIDGDIHWEQEHMVRDTKRTRRLEECGYRVIRFGNYRVMRDIDGVLEELARELEFLPALRPIRPLRRVPLPRPLPSSEGRGKAASLHAA